jgi:molybdate transport system substrate-binding protein
MTPIIPAITAEFERCARTTLKVSYASAGAIKEQMQSGAAADVAIVRRAVLDDLGRQGTITAAGITDIASSSIGVFVRAGSRHPDISTTESLKASLLGAQSIAYTNPTAGAPAGVYFAELLEQLGLAGPLKSKTKLLSPPGTNILAAVASGASEIGITQVSEALGFAGVETLMPLPSELQIRFVTAAGVAAKSSQPKTAEALIDILLAPSAAAAIKASGLEPASHDTAGGGTPLCK